MTAQKESHYATLGVPEDASKQKIKEAFITLSKSCHPDINPKGHEKFIKIYGAYKVLSDPRARYSYDSELAYRKNCMYNNETYGNRINRDAYRWTTYEPPWEARNHRSRKVDEDCYYGIKGIKRVSNGWIVAGCIVLMLLSSTLHYIGARSLSKRRAKYQKISAGRLYRARELEKMQHRLETIEAEAAVKRSE